MNHLVHRIVVRDAPDEKYHADDHFVLDLTHDAYAIPAIAAYADACEAEYPLLAADLRDKIAAKITAASEFITVPETTLPNGTVVPAFMVSRYLASKGPAGLPLSVPHAAPWVEINFNDAKEACERINGKLITETQALSIAWNISQQDINWTGGKVGEGKLYQGLHKGTVSSAQPGDYEPSDAEERRWHQLSTGERIYDFAGNAYTLVFDDVQGDENGLIAKPFADDSVSIQAPYPSMEKGMGWRPEAGANWSGYALVRGGYWASESSAGAFYLAYGWPDFEHSYVGFRCTQ